MKKFFSIATLMVAVSPLFAQLADCNKTIVDQANVLSSSDMSSLSTAVTALTREGADPHVITTNSSLTQEQFIAQMKDACPSWQNPAKGVKGNLVVFMLSPNARKMGIFPGEAYRAALSDAVTNDIKKNFMGPYFRSAAWGTGLTKGVEQSTNRIVGYESAAARPNSSGKTVINNEQPTDLSGLWTFLKLLLLLAVVVGGVILVFALNSKRKAKKLSQLAAISARNDATSLLTRISTALKEKVALGVKVTIAQNYFDNISSDFATLGSSIQNDPTDDSMSQEAYENIADSYNKIVNRLNRIYIVDDKTAKKHAKVTKTKAASHVTENEASYRNPVYTHPNTTVIHEDHYHDNSNNLLTGVLVGEALSRPSYTEPSYRESSHSRSHDSDDSSSSYSGSSSSWDDSSSSSFDSGSSSSFDSGSSSDFGGSSSDF